jgi:hypothetical protein
MPHEIKNLEHFQAPSIAGLRIKETFGLTEGFCLPFATTFLA